MVLNIPCATIAVSRALKAEEITGLSNGKYCGFKILVGLEESRITWFSNLYTGQRYRPPDLEEDRITGFSNSTFQPQAGLEGDRITGLSTIVNGQLYWVWKGIGLYGTQTAE